MTISEIFAPRFGAALVIAKGFSGPKQETSPAGRAKARNAALKEGLNFIRTDPTLRRFEQEKLGKARRWNLRINHGIRGTREKSRLSSISKWNPQISTKITYSLVVDC